MNYTKLKALSAQKGISLGFISRSIGKNRSYFFMSERDGITITDENMKKIASLLGTTVAYLTDETDDPLPDDAELLSILDELRNDPDRRMLFHTLKGCSKEDILQAVKIIEALKK